MQAYERRFISVFAYYGWNNFYTTLTTGSAYPSLTNLAGTTFTYIQGSSYNKTTDFPLNWDRINILLPGNESTTKFSVAIPTTYTTTSAHLFEILIGKIDITTGLITYMNSEPMPAVGTTTYLLPENVAVYSKPKSTSTLLNVAGKAASYMSNISFSVSPSGSFAGNSYSSALIVVSNWNFFDSTSSLASTSLSSVDPIFANVEQTPLSLQLTSTNYLTYIPFTTTAGYSTLFNIYFNSIKLPYNLDLPYYSVQLIDHTGTIDGYN